jgi:hypothetical protein
MVLAFFAVLAESRPHVSEEVFFAAVSYGI